MYALLLFGLIGMGGLAAAMRVALRRPSITGVWIYVMLGAVIQIGVTVTHNAPSLAHLFHAHWRTWGVVGPRAVCLVLGTLAGLSAVFLLNGAARRLWPSVSPWAELAGGIGGTVWGMGAWHSMLLYLNQVSAGVAEPILDLHTAFFRYTLPFLDDLRGLLLWIAAVCTATSVAASIRAVRPSIRAQAPDLQIARSIAVASAALGVALGWSALLHYFHALGSHLTPIGDLILFAATLVLGVSPLLRSTREWMGRLLRGVSPSRYGVTVLSIGTAWVAIGLVWVLAGSAFQPSPAVGAIQGLEGGRLERTRTVVSYPRAAVWLSSPSDPRGAPAYTPGESTGPVHL